MGNFNAPINLIGRFADAGLPLQLATAPIARAAAGAELVFQMDIRRGRSWDPHSEYYVAWPGGDDNLVVVQGVDKKEEQLVMMVREPQQWFWEPVPAGIVRQARRRSDWRAFIAREGRVAAEDLHKENEAVWVRRTTDARKRHFLVGRDERQLFMCRLPRACTTVAEAHTALRVPEAKAEARGVLERAIRQGEWFFVPADAGDVTFLDGEIARRRLMVRRQVSIGAFIARAGKPHIVDELVEVRDERGNRRMFVRGRVRHVDHRTVRLYRWYRVFRNREVDDGRSPFGGGWVD